MVGYYNLPPEFKRNLCCLCCTTKQKGGGGVICVNISVHICPFTLVSHRIKTLQTKLREKDAMTSSQVNTPAAVLTCRMACI